MKVVLPVPRGPNSATCVPAFNVPAALVVNAPRETASAGLTASDHTKGFKSIAQVYPLSG